MDTREINTKIRECDLALRKLAYKFTKNPEDVQDLVQETLMRSLKYLDQFFQNPKVIGWLYVIMKHIYINQFRRQKQKYAYDNYKASESQNLGYLDTSDTNTAEGTFIINDVLKLLSQFPKQHEELFSKFIDGYKYKELSIYYDLPEGTIKSRIHVMKKSLRKKLIRLN